VRTGLSPAGKVACLQPAHPSSTLLLVGVSKSANLFSLNELAVLLPFASVPRNFFSKKYHPECIDAILYQNSFLALYGITGSLNKV
jgi:hypothetical protein